MGVNITLANGGLGGTLQTNDGIVGMVLTGGIDDAGYVLGTPKLLTGLASMAAAGISTSGNAFAVKEITEFYLMAGDGAQLYLMLVPNTVSVDDIAHNTNADGAKKLLDYAQGAIKVLGIMTDDTALDTPTITNGLNADVYTAITNMQALAEDYFDAETPFRAIIAGTSYNGVAADLRNMTTGTSDNRVGMLIGNTVAGDGADVHCAACMGLLLGQIAAVPVQRKVSRIRNKALPINQAYIADMTLGDPLAQATVIAGKGFITFRSFPNKAGFFWSGDPMCTATTDDYNTLSHGRVIDKAHIIAYTTFVDEVDDEVPVDPNTGTLSVGYTRHLRQQIENQVNTLVTGKQEISGFKCDIPLNQNIISTNELHVSLAVTPVGYNSEINITLGFKNPALTQ